MMTSLIRQHSFRKIVRLDRSAAKIKNELSEVVRVLYTLSSSLSSDNSLNETHPAVSGLHERKIGN